MKKAFCASMLCMAFLNASAQVNPTADEEKNMKTLASVADTGWTRKGNATLGVTGSYFSQWAAGGVNSGGINGLMNFSMNYRNGKNAWDNTIIMAYGVLNQGFTTRNSWVKTDDRFDITSKYGLGINDKLFYAGLLNFNTQFLPGFAPGADGLPDRQTRISNFMAPGRLLLALGMDYKPNADLSIFFSPITYRGIFVLDPLLSAQGAYGVEKGEVLDTLIEGRSTKLILKDGATARHELGAYLRVNYSKKFNDKVTLTSKFELFSNYLDKPQNVDLSWESIISCKLGKYFSLTTSVNFLYDDNTSVAKTRKETVTNTDNSTTTTTIKYPSKGLQTRVISTLGLTWNF